MHLKMSSGKWRPSCFGLNVLNLYSNVFIGWFRAARGVCMLVFVADGGNTPHQMTRAERHYLVRNSTIVYCHGHCNVQKHRIPIKE